MTKPYLAIINCNTTERLLKPKNNKLISLIGAINYNRTP